MCICLYMPREGMDGNISNQEQRLWGGEGRGQEEDIPLYSLSCFLVFEPCECITHLKNKGDLKSLMTLYKSEDAKSPQFLVV